MDWLTVSSGFLAASQDIESIVKAKVEIDFTGTDTFVEIPGDLVDSINGVDKLTGTTGYAIANTCTIRFNNSDKRFSKNVFAPYNPSIGQYNGPQQSDTRGNLRPGRKVRVSVSVGVGNEWLQKYAGFVGDNGFVETIGAANSNIVTISCVDLGKYLKDASLKTPGGATPVYIDRKISDPADQGNSLVHIIGGLAGLSPGDIIADTIPILETYSPLTGSAWDELAYLAEVVFATLTVTPDNKVFFGDSRYATGYTPPTSQFTFNNDNAFNIGNPDDFANIRNDITLKFSIPEWLDRQTIWQFKENYDTTTGKCNYVIPAGDTSLSITDPDVEYSPQYGIYQAGKEFEVLSARNISNQIEFESLLETSGGDLDVVAYDVTKYPARAVLRLANNEALPVTLEIAKIKGEPLVRNEDTEVRRDDTTSISLHGRKEQVIQSKYFTDYIVASGKPHWSDFIQYYLEWKRTPRQLFSWSVQIPVLQAQVGSRVTLAEVLTGTGINEIGTVTQITWDLKDGRADMRFSMRWELDNPTPPEDIIPTLISQTGDNEIIERDGAVSSPQLTIEINKNLLGATASGEASIYGFDTYGNPDPTSTDGFIYIDGQKIEIPRHYFSPFVTLITERIGKGYILFRYRNGYVFSYVGNDYECAFVKFENGQWHYDDNGTQWQVLSQAVIDDSVIIGTIETDTPDHIKTAQIWMSPQDVAIVQLQDWDGIEGDAKADDYADVTGDQTVAGLLPNWNLDIRDSELKPAGIRGIASITNRSQIEFGDSNQNTLKILGAPDSSVAYGFPAIPVDEKATYRIVIRHRSENPPSTNGYYLRMEEKNDALSPGKTHVGQATGESVTDVRTSVVQLLTDAPTPGQTYIINTYQYIPTPGAKYATFSIYNFPGITGWVEIDYVQIDIKASAERDATVGAPVTTSTTAPPDPVVGQIWINPDSGRNNRRWDGTSWVYISLQSSDYTPGSAGWFIDETGNSEFNDGTFRGTLSAAGSKFLANDTGVYFADYDQSTSPSLGDKRVFFDSNVFKMQSYTTSWVSDFVIDDVGIKVNPGGALGGLIIDDANGYRLFLGGGSPDGSYYIAVGNGANYFSINDPIKLGTFGDTIREKKFANVTIGANSSLTIATFLGNTNTVYCSATHREASTTARNDPKTSQATVGSDRVVTGWNTAATTRTIQFLMEQAA
jgi:hypothetical protein